MLKYYYLFNDKKNIINFENVKEFFVVFFYDALIFTQSHTHTQHSKTKGMSIQVLRSHSHGKFIYLHFIHFGNKNLTLFEAMVQYRSNSVSSKGALNLLRYNHTIVGASYAFSI